MDRDEELLRELSETETRLKELCNWSRRSGWTWPAVGAVLGLGGGILAVADGTLLSAIAWARGEGAGVISLHGVGSILLLSTIPLLILGAHCLDLLEGRMGRSPQQRGARGPVA